MRGRVDRDDVKPIKVDIVVHGRFHGFALAKALMELGHDTVVHTNYPPSVVEEFGVPRRKVRSLLIHGLGTRAASKLGSLQPTAVSEPFFHKAFGRWAAHSVRPDSDLIYGFSGVMKEMLRRPRGHSRQVRTVVRGSAHVREQARLLEEEEARAGRAVDRPSKWIIGREEREYLLADCILVLSSFAFNSFVARGIDARRLLLNPLGVNVLQFRPEQSAIEARIKRIMSGAPLRVLNVGTFSYRKGAIDFVKLARGLHKRFEFKFVGDRPAESQPLWKESGDFIDFVDRMPEAKLSQAYQEADLFVFQTIEDGFAAVLLQAAAACLPLLATTNSSAPDFVVEGKNGFILPIRQPQLFAERLKWCDSNRDALATMVRNLAAKQVARSWQDMAKELISHYRDIALVTDEP